MDDIVGELSDNLFNTIVNDPIDELEPELAEMPPPALTRFGQQSADTAADDIALTFVRLVGKMQVESIEDLLGSAAPNALQAIDALGKYPRVQRMHEDDRERANARETLLDVFLERERVRVLARLQELDDVLRPIVSAATHDSAPKLFELDRRLWNATFVFWLEPLLEYELTMGWMNLCTRLSLAPHEIVHGGMLDITVELSFGREGAELRFVSAKNEAGPGASDVLSSARDEHGTPYTLATLPVYRRVWLKTGDSRLDVSPAFVITPEGEIEPQVGADLLAAIGAGRQGADVPKADARIGAKVIVSMLRGVGTEQLQ